MERERASVVIKRAASQRTTWERCVGWRGKSNRKESRSNGSHEPYRRRREVEPGIDTGALADELARDILEARLIANLATFNSDGSIHLVAMWFLWDGEVLLSPTHRGTRKARNLQRDSRATVMIDDSKGGFDLRGVTLACEAEVLDLPASRELNRRVHLRYVTEAGLELDPVKRYLATDDVTLRLRPTKISSWDLRNTEQGRALLETGAFHRLEAVH